MAGIYKRVWWSWQGGAFACVLNCTFPECFPVQASSHPQDPTWRGTCEEMGDHRPRAHTFPSLLLSFKPTHC